MNRFETSSLGFEPDALTVAPSTSSYEPVDRRSRPGRGWLDYAQVAVAFFASTVTPPPLPWLADRRRDTATVIILQVSPYRRRITLSEARKLALDVIRQAEDRRSLFAEEEARRAMSLGVEV